MSESDLPGSPGAVFAQPSDEREPLVVLELDRRAAMLDGIETETCIMCGVSRAETPATIHVRGRFSSVAVRASLCRQCLGDTREAHAKVSRLNGVVRSVYFAQLAALVVTMATGGGAFLFSGLSVLLLGTMAGSFVVRKRALRDMPRLLATKATSVTIRAPRAWARVLSDEKPRALVRPALNPAAGPASPR